MCAQILTLLEEDKNSHQVVESLSQSGHKVSAVQDFNRAIGLLQERRFDLIISDVHLQNGGNVFDFLKWVKKNPKTSDIPFVLFSSQPSELAKYIEDGVRTSARVFGAAMYITMDVFNSDEFRKQIDSLLPKRN